MLAKYGNSRFSDQSSYSLAMNHKIKLKNNIIIDKLIEYKDADYSEGVIGSKKDNLLTLNAAIKFDRKWSLNMTHANRRISSDVGLVARDSVSELATGFDFEQNRYFDGLQLQVGYANLKFKGSQLSNVRNTDSIFLLLRYVKNI